jgi:hypothetical protein
MIEPIRICVPYDLGRLTPNQRIHPQEQWRRQKALKMAAYFAYLQAGFRTLPGKVRVTLIVRRGRVIDPDNLAAASKHLIDALFCSRKKANRGLGITPDDSARYVEYAPVQQETGAQWKGREQVEVIVEPLEAQP